MTRPVPTVTIFDGLCIQNQYNLKKNEKMHTTFKCNVSIFRSNCLIAAIVYALYICIYIVYVFKETKLFLQFPGFCVYIQYKYRKVLHFGN